MGKKKIFLVSGRTGCGKDTIVNHAAEKFGLNILKSYTTRPRREGEGDTHIFIESKDMDKYSTNIFARTNINGYSYFSTFDQLNTCDFYIIDPVGINMVRRTLDEDKYEIVNIYIYTPDHIRYDRAINIRHDNEEIYMSRNFSENQQFSDFEKDMGWDYLIVNTDLNNSIEKMKNILIKEGAI